MTGGVTWVRACAVGEIDEEDVRRFDHGGKRYAVYRIHSGYYASEGRCTHEKADLTKGFVIDGVIECPLHQGRFDIRTGRAGVRRCASICGCFRCDCRGGEVIVGLPSD